MVLNYTNTLLSGYISLVTPEAYLCRSYTHLKHVFHTFCVQSRACVELTGRWIETDHWASLRRVKSCGCILIKTRTSVHRFKKLPNFWFEHTTIPFMALGFLYGGLLQLSRAELARAPSPLPVKWVTMRQGNLLIHLPLNVSQSGTLRPNGDVSWPPTGCVYGDGQVRGNVLK